MTERAPKTEITHPATTSRSRPGISKTLHQIVEKITPLRPDRIIMLGVTQASARESVVELGEQVLSQIPRMGYFLKSSSFVQDSSDHLKRMDPFLEEFILWTADEHFREAS